MDLMSKKDPWAKTHCGMKDCLICNSKSKTSNTPANCRQESVCYMMSCDRCKTTNITAQYCGESARTGYLRGREHARGQVKKSEDNALFKHDEIHHAGEQGTYSMVILRKHKKPLSRQMHEATNIENSKADIVMNSKGEMHGARVPRITVEMGARTYSEEYRGGLL